MPLVSIIIPVIRPESAARCIEAVRRNAGIPPEQYEVLTERDTEGIGCPRMVKRLVERSRGEHVCFLGDDTIPQPGFLAAALEVMRQFPDGWGLVALNDGIHDGRLATHWLASRKLLPLLGGEFFHTGYQHNFCDLELTRRCRELGRYAYAKDARIRHDHPLAGGVDDAGRRKPRETYLADQVLYWRRLLAGQDFKLGIGFPVIDTQVYLQFFLSYIRMEKPDYTIFVPTFPHGEFPQNIAAARNSIVAQALHAGCTHLMMMDTDQIYPPDCLTKLLSHQKDIVGVRVHRRWPPFDVVMMRGEVGRYRHVPDDECFSGELVEVDATGTGCLLINTRVFLDVPQPWFEFEKTDDGRPVGEDIAFCAKARRAGYRIFVDTSIEVGHLALLEVGRTTYELFKSLNGIKWRK